jgi:hydrogenase maturation protease
MGKGIKSRKMKTLVVGLGNPILTDDGVGVKVAYEIQRVLTAQDQEQITVTEASVGGLRLMEMMIGYERAIIIDALIGRNEDRPGTMYRMTLDDLRDISPTQHSACAHDTSLVTALDMGKKIGLSLPKEIIIFAVEVENVIDFSEQPTTAVSEAIPKLIDAVLGELNISRETVIAN